MDSAEGYDAEHAVEVMKMLNQDRKVKKEFCDGMIVAEGKEHAVHKCVVGVVSPFFGRTFITEMQEKYENVVKITNIAPETLENILDFVYTGFAKVTEDNVTELLDGAEFAQIPRIKATCSNYLKQKVNVGNCLKIRAWAQRYNLDDLQNVAYRVIAENFVAILEQNDFVELSAEEVSIIVRIRKDQVNENEASEEAVFTAIVHWVNHNLEERQSLFAKLFSYVALDLMSQNFLNQKLKSEPLVFNSLECMQHLLSMSSRLILTKGQELSVIVMGGEASERNCVAHHFNPDNTEDLPMLNVARCGAAACKVGNQLYLIGGADKVKGGEAYKSVEVLELQCRSAWKETSDMLEARKHAACAVLDDIIYVCGGWNHIYLSFCEKYDCITHQWSGISNMVHKRGYHALAVLDDSLYCAGGIDGTNYLLSAERYDRATDVWEEICPMTTKRRSLALVALNGYLYAIGGFNDAFLATVERYDQISNKWTRFSPLHVARFGHGAAVFHGRIYVFGGGGVKGRITSVEVYDEFEDKWEICYEMKQTALASTVIAL